MYETGQEQSRKTVQVTGLKAKPVAFSRYFIELQVAQGQETSRAVQDQMRRQQALEFVQVFEEWMKENDLKREVSSLSVTAMGQVMIVCSNRVIDQIREQDVWGIAHIRSSDQFSKLGRVGSKN